MARLFTDKYGIKCTWTGRGKNIITKIGDSELIKTMKSNFKFRMPNYSYTFKIVYF